MAATIRGATHSITEAAMPEALVQALAIAVMHPRGLLTVIRKLRVGTLHPAVRAEPARVRSVTMGTARRPRAFLHAAALVLHPHTAAGVVVHTAVVVEVHAAAATGNCCIV